MRKVVALAVVLLTGWGAGCSYLWQKELVIEITQEQIQERVDPAFPISEVYLKIFRLTLTDPQVVLTEGSNRVGLGVAAATNIRVNDKDLTGKTYITSTVRYDCQDGSLLLVDPRVEELTISLLPEEYQEEVLLAANLSAKKFLKDYEIYRLNQADFKQRLVKLVLKDVVVQNGVLRVTLGLGK